MGPIWGGNETLQMYGKFEGFPLDPGVLFGLVKKNDPPEEPEGKKRH